MRIFKTSQAPTPADEAAAVRLMAVASRGKGNGSFERLTEAAGERPAEVPFADTRR